MGSDKTAMDGLTKNQSHILELTTEYEWKEEEESPT